MFPARYFPATFFAPRYYVEAATVEGPALGAPALAYAYSTETGIRLTWGAASGGAGGYVVNVHRSTTSGFTPSGVTAGSGTCVAADASSPYDDATGLAQNTRYFYKLVVVDALGDAATSNQVTAGLAYDGTVSGGSGSTGVPVQVYTNIDVFRADAWESSEGVGRTLSVTYDSEPWPDTISTAHFYCAPTAETLDDNEDAASLEDVACVVDVATGSGRKVTINLTADDLETLQASLRGVNGYRWWLIANKDTKPATLRSGTMTVRPDPTAV